MNGPANEGTHGETRRLSDHLRGVLAGARDEPVAVRGVVEALGERGHALAMVLFALPFLQPVPTMGLSAPFGFAVAAMGACVCLRIEPRVPGFLARRQVPPEALAALLVAAARTAARFEHLLRPRLQFMLGPGPHVLLGLGLIFAGIALGLPIPLPFANAVPGAAILLFAIGMLERDGAMVLAGHAVCAATLVLAVVLWESIGAALGSVFPVLG